MAGILLGAAGVALAPVDGRRRTESSVLLLGWSGAWCLSEGLLGRAGIAPVNRSATRARKRAPSETNFIQGHLYTQIYEEGNAAGTQASPNVVFTVTKESDGSLWLRMTNNSSVSGNRNAIKVEIVGSTGCLNAVTTLSWEAVV